MADTDKLRPEVRKALEVCDRDLPETWHSQTTQWGVIRAELLRLARDNADLREADTFGLDQQLVEYKRRAERAEAELAALKARMFQGIVLDVDYLARGHAGLPSEWRGKRVRLLVED